MIKWGSLNAALVLPGDCGRCCDSGVGIGVVCGDRTSLQRVAVDEVIWGNANFIDGSFCSLHDMNAYEHCVHLWTYFYDDLEANRAPEPLLLVLLQNLKYVTNQQTFDVAELLSWCQCHMVQIHVEWFECLCTSALQHLTGTKSSGCLKSAPVLITWRIKKESIELFEQHQTRVSVTLGVHVKVSLSMLPSSRTDFWSIQLTMSSFYYIILHLYYFFHFVRPAWHHIESSMFSSTAWLRMFHNWFPNLQDLILPAILVPKPVTTSFLYKAKIVQATHNI